MKVVTFPLISLSLALILAACAAPAAQIEATASTLTPASAGDEANPGAGADLTRIDEQGAVAVVVTPLNLTSPNDTLDFEIALDTHSVDLSMDLTTLALLSTDTGVSVTPISWDGSTGGHHVSGVLSFPTVISGRAILQDAARLTLTIREVDAPERTFVWELGG